MNVENVMTKGPVCCSASDTVQHVAQLMKEQDVGAIPVVADMVSRQIVGIITDRDLCISALAEGKDPRTTTVAPYFTKTVITCRPGDTLEACEARMKEHKIRRIPVVDKNNSCVGIVVQADIARAEKKPENFQALIFEISRPSHKKPSRFVAA